MDFDIFLSSGSFSRLTSTSASLKSSISASSLYFLFLFRYLFIDNLMELFRSIII